MNNLWITLDIIFQNKFFIIPIVAMLIAQVIKMVFYFIKHRRFNFKLLFSTGSMPSSHSSMVCALATLAGLDQGWNSLIFATALIFSLIVMYDAAGVRRAAGRQAQVLNKIVDEFIAAQHLEGKRLKELIGHSPVEVWAGAAIGIITALLFY